LALVACCDVTKLGHAGPGHKSAVSWEYGAAVQVTTGMGRPKVFGLFFAPQVRGCVMAVTHRAGGPI
jgi:hypothetical protein